MDAMPKKMGLHLLVTVIYSVQAHMGTAQFQASHGEELPSFSINF